MFCGIKYALFFKGIKLFINESAFKNPREVKNPQWSEGQDFFFLFRTNKRGGGRSSAALRGTSLCCVNGCWAFIWQYLTHGRRCTWMSHNSKPDRLNRTYCTGYSNIVGAKWDWSFYFVLSLKYRWCLLVSPTLTVIYTKTCIWNSILTILPDGTEIV